jgi:hypothetical protein
MLFFDLEVLKEKPIKSKRIMPHLKLSKKCFWDKKKLKKKNKNCNSSRLMKIWSSFNHSKVPNY